MMRLVTAAAALIGTMVAAAPAADGTSMARSQRMWRDMAALSTDAMDGRRPGTRGEQPAIRYIVDAFRKAGLEPASPSGWLQPVALEERTPQAGRFTVGTGPSRTDLSADVLLLGKRPLEQLRARTIVYAGHADRAGAPSGAIALYRDRSRFADPLAQATDDRSRREFLADAGAAVVLSIVDARTFERLKSREKQGFIQAPAERRAPVHGYIREAAADRLLAGRLQTLDKNAAAPAFRPVTIAGETDVRVETAVRRFASSNVIGRIKGRAAPAEALIYTAHWDGLGRCRPGAADPICNGAADNGSGVAGLIELARMFSSGERPDRTILFIATTAEESGLLGARAYVAAPVVPLGATVASINIDTIALYGKGQAVGFVGAGLTDADELLARAAAAQGRRLDSGEGARFVAQVSDAWPLLKAGVPAFILSGAISRAGTDRGAAFQDLITTRVHTPADEIHPNLNLAGAVEDIELAHSVGETLARRNAWIDFLPGAAFRRPPRR